MPKVRKILLVCTGNSCRSVMAAGLLKKMLEGRGDYTVMTAGTSAAKGLRPTFEAYRVMADNDVHMPEHLSQPLSNEMIKEADLILVMERRHKEDILTRAPDAKNKVYLLSEFGRIEGEDKLVDPDIPDPIGRSLEFYRQVFEIIREAILRTVNKLTEIS